MKNKDILMLIFMTIFSMYGYTQNTPKTDLKRALDEIAQKYSVNFSYDNDLVSNKKVVEYTNWNENLSKKLERILTPHDLEYAKISDKYYVIKSANLATNQNKILENSKNNQSIDQKLVDRLNIQGTIYDENDQPAIGVTIMKKNTFEGTISDFNGGYEIKVNPNDILVISFIGYKTVEVPVLKKTIIDIYLEVESAQLEEVIVVAYGVQKRAHLTGSVATLKASDIAQNPIDNLTNMLGGRLPGVVTRQQSGVPGDNSAKFFIRGRSSPTGSGEPLYIVDGVERRFDNLDPNEIETITILKDASAAMYGVRAANGVVLVTTKGGKESKTINLNYTSTLSISNNTAFPEYPDGVDYALWHNKARHLDGLAPDYTDSDIEKIRNGDPDGLFGNTNWTKLIFEPFAPQTYQNLNISGGNSKLRFFNNLGYLKQEGIIKGVSFDRVNLRSNVEYNVNDNFSVNLNIAGRLEEREQPGTSPGSQDITINNFKNIIFYSILARPTSNAFTPDGTPLGWGNPLVARDMSGFFNQKRKILQTSGTLRYKVPQVKGLNLRTTYSYDYENGLSRHFMTPQRMATIDYAQRQLVYFDRLMPKDISSNLNELTQRYNDFARTTFQLGGDYTKEIGKSTINGLFLYEEQSTFTSNFGLSAQDLPLASLPDLNFATDYIPNSLFGGRNRNGTRGIVNRIGYVYDDKYMVEFTGRADWSSRFAKGNRLGIFPALSAGWTVSRESFFEPLRPYISRLKLRGSAGILGNDAIGEFRYLKTFNLSRNPQVIFGDRQYLDLLTGAVPNIDIKWEKTTTFNGGMELDILDGMITLEADAFYKVTRDILQSVAGVFPPSVGGNFPSLANAGVMDARGFEAVVTYRKFVNKNLTYTLAANTTFATNRFISTDESPNVPEWQRRTGQPLGAVLGWVSDGLFQNDEEIANSALTSFEVKPGFIKYKDLNGDGKIDFADRTWIARSPIPELFFGVNMGVTYKKISMNVFLQGASRTDLLLTGEYIDAGFSDGTFFTQPFKWSANTPFFILENTWQQEGDITEFPRLGTVTPFNNNLASDFWKRNASYLRLKNVEISYTFDIIQSRYGKGKNLTLFLSGTNLYTFSRLNFIDPEAPNVNNGFYPQQRVYNFGINLSI